MENLRNRTLKEVENAKIFSVQKFAKDLLTTSDTLAICLKATPSSLLDTNSALKNLYDGVIMTQKTLDACFKRFGMSQYDPIGEKFDPNLHEALFKVKIDGKKSGTVFQTSQTGYMIHGRVIRPAQVGVVADSDDDDDEKQNGKDQDK